ncbi:LEAF RUST 10 DISEASE-RESISTANCE LOCUS RECEPTOR-LIKE PROTEIN KINASE-like 1.2 isoform X4 [Triticum urartu]|uniref:LEAF RUST 10 DISEASE-RESISTANCE LOCUS RECEPTOR-LIKE PROTEIN KINASE-like 1.2 isoform X4 n=1 Tax=Triticum urartu TaxID=4572 RepID=UPI002043192F|nr:LEAF RUST 10 DISEASE-RESISTANCE LOCUS RECEPTOR-LIKE PROTEIN KINASE-like 1.2 isoform X4 [Triticum urartu]
MSCCWFLVLAGVWWLPPMLVVAEDQQGGDCSAMKCGNVSIFHPFSLTDRETGRSCGPDPYPDFDVACINNSVPALRSSIPLNQGFEILNISYQERSLYAVDMGKLGVLQAPDKCRAVFYNTSVKLNSPFRIAPVNLHIILYNCTEEDGAAAVARRNTELVETRVRCWNEWEVLARTGVPHDVTGNYSGYALDGCRAIVVPMLASSAGASASDYEQLMRDGFLLTWELPHLAPAPAPRISNEPPPPARDSGKTSIKFIIVGAVAGFAAFLAFVLFALYQRKKSKQTVASNEFMRSGSSMTSYSKDLELGGSPHIFTFEELEVATDGFSASRELGDGGFGTVYKGKLKDGRVVAVKRLYKNNYRRVEQFLNEVDILSRLLHQNLVILYGCTSRMSRDLLLVYEFIANGTVADHLHGSHSAERGLTWPLRLNIAIETAEALAYLHAVEIIHRDVKTTNILLDNNFHVKVADFGLSRLFPLEVTHVSTVPQGTPGYVDPVYHQCYKLTDKSDVYSFGVVLVELISSKPAVDMSRSQSEINLANMALNRIQNHEVFQLVDPELGYDTDPETKRTIDRVAEVAFQCLQMERDLRPSIKEVVEILTYVRDGDYRAKSMKKKASQKEDAHLLTNDLQFSPDSVIHRFHSQSTNHSVASNASGL